MILSSSSKALKPLLISSFILYPIFYSISLIYIMQMKLPFEVLLTKESVSSSISIFIVAFTAESRKFFSLMALYILIGQLKNWNSLYGIIIIFIISGIPFNYFTQQLNSPLNAALTTYYFYTIISSVIASLIASIYCCTKIKN